jgi:hypothetical protein
MAFFSGSERSPQIRGLSTSPGERHLENLKIMRTIGAKQFLSQTEELSSEETLLRRKIYTFYTGLGALPRIRH